MVHRSRSRIGNDLRHHTREFIRVAAAGKAFLQYRRARGSRTSPLPDFCIGAHAAIESMALLTRDGSRYRTYYPKLALICP